MTVRVLPKGLCLLLALAALGCDEDLPKSADAGPIQESPGFGIPKVDAGTPVISTGGVQAPVLDTFPGIAGSPAVCSVSGGSAGGTFTPTTLSGPTVKSATPPPPISGGTMLTTADGTTVVAADPERDQIYFVDAQGMKSLHTRKLNDGDQPGRVVEDAAGRIHVILRGAHAIATLGREADSTITRREVCALPRGIAYDPAGDQLHIACAEGKLVTLGAAPSALMPTRTLDVGTDARDVLVRADKLFVTRFRSAELLVLGSDGVLQETRKPLSFSHDEVRMVVDTKPSDNGQCNFNSTQETVHVEEAPDVAWRTIDVPKSGVTMLHQRAHTDEIQTTSGGYGSGSCGGGIVQTAITSGLDQASSVTADLGDLTVAVDIAADSEGQLLAVVAPGNQGTAMQIEVLQLSQLQAQDGDAGAGVSADAGVALSADAGVGVKADAVILGTAGSFSSAGAATPSGSVAGPGPGPGFAPCMSGAALPEPPGQATAVTFASPYVLAVQQREPAAISFYDVRTNTVRATVSLDQASRFDTGHTMFHMRAGAGLACASCHPEAGDDGHVWTFAKIGPRRTQTLRGGILGTEPLHWNGDMKDFGMLMTEVFVGRMSGFPPTTDQTDALSHWVDAQPALHADAADKAAAERGKLLFESTTVGCATCHSGPHLTNNQTENVGTGASLQVPSLKGVRFRTPLMHNGCAASISDRLTKPECGGGDKHGKTSQLSESDLKDLTAYLETL